MILVYFVQNGGFFVLRYDWMPAGVPGGFQRRREFGAGISQKERNYKGIACNPSFLRRNRQIS